MSYFSRTIAMSALMGGALFASPMGAMAADSTAPAPAAATAPAMAHETVDQRITTLHESLKITPAEEADWKGVAKAMRANAAEMDKLMAEKSSKDQASMTAVQDLQTYEKFAKAHVEGLKTLTSSFETLYKAMPAEQKKNADEVFQTFGHGPAASHG